MPFAFFSRILFALVPGVLTLALFLGHTFDNIELLTLDYRFKSVGPRVTSDKIVLVDIADDSINRIGRWPWTRDWHATLLHVLSSQKVKTVAMDIIFAQKSSVDEDRAFGEAVEQADNVILANFFDIRTTKENTQNVHLIQPLERLENGAKGIGFLNISPDPDGVIRRAPLVMEYQGKQYLQLALQAVVQYFDVPKENILIERGKRIRLESKTLGVVDIPIDDDYKMMINWAGKWGSDFHHYSYLDTIVSYQNSFEGKPQRFNLEDLEGKLALVGLTATGLADLKPIPLQPSYPGVGIHANIINNIITKNFLRIADKRADSAIILILGSLIAFLILKLRPVHGALIGVVLALLYALASWAALKFFNLWISLVYPVISITTSYVSANIYSAITGGIERKRLYHLATQDPLTGLYTRRYLETKLSGELKNGAGLCVVMVDIDHFKSVNDTLGHDQGDLVLKEVSRVLRQSVRTTDIVARLGGEEFVVVLMETQKENGLKVSNHIREEVRKGVKISQGAAEWPITVSMGLASSVEDHILNYDAIIKAADRALYRSKESGRNRVTAYSDILTSGGPASS